VANDGFYAFITGML